MTKAHNGKISAEGLSFQAPATSAESPVLMETT